MNDIPKYIEKNIYNFVMADLEPKALTVYLKTGLAILLGGVTSMFFCGQFGVGITGFAQDLNQNIHHTMGSVGCAALCGSLFAILPVFVLRAVCSPMQFRAIIRKKWQAPAIWLGFFGAILAYHGEFQTEFVHFAAWLIGAYLLYRYLGLAIDSIVPYFKKLNSIPG